MAPHYYSQAMKFRVERMTPYGRNIFISTKHADRELKLGDIAKTSQIYVPK
jgi:hypothetical protein